MFTCNCTELFPEQKEHEVLLDISDTCAVPERPPVCTDEAGGDEPPGQPQAYVCFSCQGVLEAPGLQLGRAS